MFKRLVILPFLRLITRLTSDNSREVKYFKGTRKASYHTILRGKKVDPPKRDK